MTHGEAAHERGTHNMFTGYRPSPAIQYPSIGSVISHELGSRNNLPAYVCIPRQPNEHAGSGYLSSSYGPFSLGSDPAGKQFAVRDLKLPKGVDDERFCPPACNPREGRCQFTADEAADDVRSMQTFYDRAYDMLASAEARKAFNLNAESEKLRGRYGMTQAGQRMILARRLIQAGRENGLAHLRWLGSPQQHSNGF